jgi:hypothetical protein
MLLAIPAAAEFDPATLPAALKDWVEWVRQGHEESACPLLVNLDADEEGSRACAWPGELSLAAGDDGARWSQRWTVYARSAVPLAGDADHWPLDVRDGGSTVPVVPDESGNPVAWLEPGSHALEGRFAWTERPESLRVPAEIALLRLSVDGDGVFPLQRDDDALWLGSAETSSKEADSLQLEVFRLLSDGIPALLTTQVSLTVSGEGREERLGKPLPDRWQPTALSGDLPARLDGDGTLIAQVRPGSYTLVLTARAPEPLASVTRPEIVEPWPAQEVWSYQAQPRLRVAQANAARTIDPAQAGVPGGWAQFPAFLLEAGEGVTVDERSRGFSGQDQNRLALNREMWLDFDGGGWSTKDQLNGSMVRGWRLDVAAPFTLTRAEEGGEGLLVTRGAQPGTSGVEVRERNVNVAASTRVADGAGTQRVGGWQNAFDNVNTAVNVPPGYRIYAALGADQAPETWLARWDLLDVFLVAITVLLARWLGGWAVGALVAGYLVLAYHEDGAPVLALLLVLGAALLAKLLPVEGWFATAIRWTRNGLLALLTLIALPFAAEQVRLALYPQLERWSPDVGYPQGMPADAFGGEGKDMVLAEPAPPPMPAAPAPQVAQEMDAVTVTGSRVRADSPNVQRQSAMKASRRFAQRYANNTVVQAGYGEPGWSWSRYQLHFSGPVTADQTVRLVVSPPWLTRLTRAVLVALLAVLLVRLARGARGGGSPPNRAAPSAPAAKLAAAALLLPVMVLAQGVPTPEMLEELRGRVLEAPDCAPSCGHIASVSVNAEGDAIGVALDVHAAERVAIPLPSADELLALESLRVDGTAESGVRRGEDGAQWLVVGRGVHRVDMALRAADADKIALRFPLAPARIEFSGRGWEGGGTRDGRLLTDTLDLVRVRGEGEAAPTSGVVQQFPPFVRVQRQLALGIDWEIETSVQRIAPDQAAFSVALPLMAGERVLSSELKVKDGRITVPMQAGEWTTAWQSQLDPAERIELTASGLTGHAEVWTVQASPMWNLRFEGVPQVYPEGDGWVHEFHPLPGEKLVLTIARPEAVEGTTLAIDGVNTTTQVGKRTVEHNLGLSLRSTQGGQHVIELPADAEVLAVTVDGQTLNVRPENGKLALPLRPGSQGAAVSWREPREIGAVSDSPVVKLNAPASNLRLEIVLPADRWVLATRGPTVGPAVLYWGELVVMIVIAWGLSRLRRTPLSFRDWLLLGLGFSTFSWPALLVVVAWLFALDWRARRAPVQGEAWFNLGQIALGLLTMIALVAVVSSLQQGLLGTPDMHLTGNGSTPTNLRWFADRSADALPAASVVSVSLWWYKAAMLAWALWLAAALIRWLKWGWDAFASGGLWRNPPPKPAAAS